MMETLYVTKDCQFNREGNTVVVVPKGRKKMRFPIETLRHVVVTGEAGVTTSLLALFGKYDVRMTVLDWYGNVSGTFEPIGSPRSGAVRLAQARHVADGGLRLELAKAIVRGTTSNLKTNLKYRAYRGNDKLDGIIKELDKRLTALQTCPDIEAVMGNEGSARAFYYEAWPLIDERLDFGKRIRRPPNNRINCLISWFNGLTYSAVRHEIAKTHLDDCLSFLHSSREARFSLALDLSESFKAAVVDPMIMEIILRGQAADAWFHEDEGVCRLSEAGRLATLDKWTLRLDKATSDGISIRNAMRNEALSLERHVLGIGCYEPFRRQI